MRLNLRSPLAIVFLIGWTAWPAQAQIFRCVDASGAVSVQQQSCPDSASQELVKPRDQSSGVSQSSPSGVNATAADRRRVRREPRAAGQAAGAASSGLADATRPAIPAPAGCTWPWGPLPQDVVVYAVNSAGNLAGAGMAIDESGGEAGLIDVIVNAPGRHVALMLSSSTSAIWRLKWTSGTKILAIWASGSDRNAVAGLQKGTPLLMTWKNGPKSACGDFVWYAQNFKHSQELATLAFGREVQGHFTHRGTALGIVLEGLNDGPRKQFVVGDPMPAGAQLQSSSEVLPESYRSAAGEGTGKMGVRNLVARGVLRAARASDYQAWIDRWLSTKDRPGLITDDKTKPAPDERLDSTYVVVKAMAFPPKLAGAHSATFLIAQGVPCPTGDPGHSTVMDFNTLKCAGPACPSVVQEGERAASLAGATAPEGEACHWPWSLIDGDFEVYAVEVSAPRQTGMRLAGQDKEADKFDLLVNRPGKKVALLLGRYDPIIWNVSRTATTQIVGVFASGYYAPLVRGLDSKTPLLTTSNIGAATGCPAFYFTPSSLPLVNTLAKRAFGRPATAFVQLTTIGRGVVGDQATPGEAIVGGLAGDHRDVLTGGVVNPLIVAVNDALAKGVLRRATMGESSAHANAWRKSQRLPPVPTWNTDDPREEYRVYVVLKPFVIPSGLTPLQKIDARFIVPRGVSPPTGDLTDIGLHDWNRLP